MAEGFFPPHQLAIPGLSFDHLCAAMVRILPRTTLVLDIAADPAEREAKTRNQSQPDGSELWHRCFAPEDVAKANDPEFAMAMVRHEFSRLVRAGAQFPASVALDGGGSGFAIDAAGHVLTNYHLAIGEIINLQREAGIIGVEVLCRSLRAQIAVPDGQGAWQWRDAESLWLVSNPPKDRALQADESGLLHPREDTALLRVVPAPQAHLRLSNRLALAHEPVWMAGFPIRSARAPQALAARGYADADGSLRVSQGQVTEVDGQAYFATDLDGSMGNSGSPVLDAHGAVIGMFTRATGQGARNAFEYGHVQRVHVSARLAMRGLQLDSILQPSAPPA